MSGGFEGISWENIGSVIMTLFKTFMYIRECSLFMKESCNSQGDVIHNEACNS